MPGEWIGKERDEQFAVTVNRLDTTEHKLLLSLPMESFMNSMSVLLSFKTSLKRFSSNPRTGLMASRDACDAFTTQRPSLSVSVVAAISCRRNIRQLVHLAAPTNNSTNKKPYRCTAGGGGAGLRLTAHAYRYSHRPHPLRRQTAMTSFFS